ncbi:MAG: hypothetical protein OEY15_07710 [Myxococcales bacterium]|nr:hypothetical protein [Myxococcales bacterium]
MNSASAASWGLRSWLLLFAGFLLLGIALYRAALWGPFVSDDVAYLVANPYTSELSLANVLAMLDPWGPAKFYTANYAPLHLLLSALERQAFGDAPLGYHLVNVGVHALVGTLLVAWFRRAGAWPRAALLGGLLFIVHPANVEAVAWASQLKTCAGLAFALGALLALPAAPAWATLLFVLSLLTKASAGFALPTAAAFAWLRRRRGTGWGVERRWLAVWLFFALWIAVPQLASFERLGPVRVEAYADSWLHLRTIAAVGARYLVMAASGCGVSAFQEPAPAASWLDPWWLAALPLGAALSLRTVATLRRGAPEAGFWIAAAAGFAPVSQVFPFLSPVADRYLYFLLPGLMGGALLWAQDGLAWHELRVAGRQAARRGAARSGALLAAVGLSAWFAFQSAQRAPLWNNETLLLLDAATHTPDGTVAHFLRARSAAQAGDVPGAVGSLRSAAARGLDRFLSVRDDPGLAPIREHPAFREVVREMAGRWIATARRRGYRTQPELHMLALAHLERGELVEAVRALEASLAAGGPLSGVVRDDLALARARLAARERSAARPDPPVAPGRD